MRRKVVKHGPSTFIISLPAKWVKAHAIEKGETLDVRPRGDTLVVSRDPESERVLSEDISALQPALVREYIRRAYVEGYDRVEVTHNDIRSLETIQALLPELLGYVIIQQDDAQCIVQSISKELDIDFPSALGSALDIVKSMVDDVVRSNRDGSQENLRGLRLQLPGVTKMTNFCRRQLNRKAVSAKYDHGDMHCFIEELSELAGMIERLGSILTNAHDSARIQPLLDLLAEQLKDAKALYEQEGRTGANALHDTSVRLQDAISAADDGPDPAIVLHLAQVCDAVEHMVISHVLSLTDLRERPAPEETVSGTEAVV